MMNNLGLYFENLERDLSRMLDCVNWNNITDEQGTLLKSIENHLNSAKEETGKILEQQDENAKMNNIKEYKRKILRMLVRLRDGLECGRIRDTKILLDDLIEDVTEDRRQMYGRQ